MPKSLVSSNCKMIPTACDVLVHGVFFSSEDLQDNDSRAPDVMISMELSVPC